MPNSFKLVSVFKGIQRQTAYSLIRLPRTWSEINAPTKSHYKKMYAWLMDPLKLDKIPHKAEESEPISFAIKSNTPICQTGMRK
jgi:hypothetical protein